MAEQRSCIECGNMMQQRLGNYECPNCGHTESAAAVQLRVEGAGRHLTDASAAAKLMAKREAEKNIAQTFDAPAGTYNPYEKKAKKADTLRDEKIICLVIALAGMGYSLYYWLMTEDGQVHLGEFATFIKVTDLRALSAEILVGASVIYLMTVAALFSNVKALKTIMALVTALIPLGCIAGIISGGLAYNMFFSVAGFILMISGAVLMAVLGHDISHEATGV